MQQKTLTETMDDVHRQSFPAGVDIHWMFSEESELPEAPENVKVMGEVKPTEQPSSSSSGIVPSQPASSSTAKDILVSGAKAGVETLAKAGATALAKSFLPL